MPSINKKLILKLKDVLGVGRAAIYARIQDVVARTRLERDLAALVLALESGINISRYSTADERALLRASVRAGSDGNAAEEISADRPRRQPRANATKARPRHRTSKNSVFVVHGRDEALRRSMFEFLRSIGLKPMEWEVAIANASGGNPSIGEIITKAMSRVQAVIVMFSPDEDAKLRSHFCSTAEAKTEGKLRGQPRPNVLFEAGVALGAHPEKTLLVQIGVVREFSDIAGKHIVRLSDDSAKRLALANRLKKFGCVVDTSGSDWLSVGNFVPTAPE